MYPNEVTAKARALSLAHKAKVDAGEEKPRESMLSFSIEAVTELLGKASDEVKAAVEEYRNKHKASDLTGLDVFLDPNADPGAAERQKRAKKIQRYIYICTDANYLDSLSPAQSRAFQKFWAT